MGKSKTLMVNSLCIGEGKSLFVMSLAYAFLMTRKRVLIIDGNFTNPTITTATGTELYLEDFLLGDAFLPSYRPITEIMVMGNRGGDTSLLEISNPENIESKLALLKDSFDIILIESEGLSSFNKSKEWAIFSDKVVTIFESGRKINYKKSQSILYLNGLEGKFIGWILNRDENEKLTKNKKLKQRKSIFSKNIELQWA
jgi:archaellum biogenesis ATPase FlaH